MNFVLQSKTNKDKSTEIAHPFSSHHLTLALVKCALCNTENQKRSAKGTNIKEDDRLCPNHYENTTTGLIGTLVQQQYCDKSMAE